MTVSSIFVQYGLALLILALNIVFLIELRATTPRAARVAWWTLAQGAALAAVWIVYDQTLRHQLRPGGFGASYLAQGYWDGSAGSLLRLAIGNTFELFAFAHPASPVLQGLLLLGVIALWRTRDGRRAVLLLVTPLVVTIACACLRLYPYIGARQMIVFTVMMYAVAASGFIELRRIDWRSLGSAIAIVWIAAEGLYGSYRTLLTTEPQHMRPIAALLAAAQQPGDRIYAYHRAVTPLRYYADEGAPLIPGVASPNDPAFHERQIAAVLAEPGRVWMVFSLCDSGECNVIRRAAASRRTVERVATATGTELYLAKAAPFPP
jgi:hypothetical protein